MSKHVKITAANNRLTSIIAYSIFGIIVIVAILEIGNVYGSFGGAAYVRQSFRPSPASAWLGVSDFYPTTNLEVVSGVFQNYQQRIITHGVSFIVIHLPGKNNVDMKLTVKNDNAPVSALLSVNNTAGDSYFRILGENELHTALAESGEYTTLFEESTNTLLFQRVDVKTSYTSLDDFFSKPPKTSIGLYYPASDQLRFEKPKTINTTTLHDSLTMDTLDISDLPDYILSSQATVLSQDSDYTVYGLQWDLQTIPISNYSRYTFNLVPQTNDIITIKPIVAKLY